MGKRIHTLAQHLLGKDSVDQCSLEEISDYANKYPFVAAAQFLLLEKYKGDEPAFLAQKQKAILYYHDPLSFQEMIHPERFITELEEVKEANPVTPPEDLGTIPVQEKKEKEKEKEKEEEEDQDVKPLAYIPATTSVSLESVAKDFRSEAAPAKENETAPSFEPFHTVDYFASQGIKLSQEDFSKDKFGKQLKSFTEWLKTMKRIPAPEGPPPEVAETRVTNLAEDSIQQEDVYTEAMAEVWIKQGNKSKAIEVYNKLSLINPSKKTYFAAQIENLKRS